MDIDIIGGSGFIGTRLVRRIREHHPGWCVRIIDKSESATYPELFVRADVRSLDALRAAIRPGSVIVNLAAEHRDDVRPQSLYEEVNVIGARNICTVADEKANATIVFTSSVAVYGFAAIGTDETGAINPFNDYGKTKYAAEQEFRRWYEAFPGARSLTIVRPTVVFGEQNRGNVYNLLRQLASNRFVMVGAGQNRKSMAYVENVAAFIVYSIHFVPGLHLHNYVDKPDFVMNELVAEVRKLLGLPAVRHRIPYSAGLAIGRIYDVAARLSRRTFPVSSIRVTKFCANSVFASSVGATGFVPPVSLNEALARTVQHEFLAASSDNRAVFYTE